jgi:2-methylisocitrate lyase-like PEP mutase family enzyme
VRGATRTSPSPGYSLQGGKLRSTELHVAVIEAVAAAAPDVFIKARTDMYWRGVGEEQERLDETVRRLTAYQEAGASGVFVPGLSDLAAIGHVTALIQAHFGEAPTQPMPPRSLRSV